jgi:glycosyltransferase involved in cell wall biosynthesis
MATEKQLKQLIAEEYTKNSSVHKIQPKVSVSLLAYNHESFIEEALDSILLQQVNFDYEIVIGEDCSQDDTREIILNYLKDNPDKIRIFLSKKPLNDRKSGRLNFVRNLKACRGEYVALLDGDDYWTSPHKLQAQVDLLDSHPEYALCFHCVTTVDEEAERQIETFSPPWQKDFYTLEDLLVGNIVATCSTVFRNKLFGDFPNWFYSTPMGDWALHILNAQHGNIGYIDESMAVYRIHKKGLWASRGRIRNYLDEAKAYRIFCNHLGKQYLELLKSHMSKRYYKAGILYEQRQEKIQALSNLVRCLVVAPTSTPVSFRHLMNDVIRCSSPTLYRSLVSFKSQLFRS